MNLRGLYKYFTKLEIDTGEEVNGWLMGECPYAPYKHESGTDHSHSFGVSIKDDGEPSYYHCFTCKMKGDLAGLAWAMAKYRDDPDLKAYGDKVKQDEILGTSDNDFGEWGEAKAERFAKETSHRITEFPDYEEFCRFPTVLESSRALRYLRRRRIPFSTAVSLGLRYDRKQRRILFPVFDFYTGRYAGCSGRSIVSDRARKQRAAELSRRYGKKITVPKVRDYGGLEKAKLLLRIRPRNNGGTRIRYLRNIGADPHTETPPCNILVEGLAAFARLYTCGYGDCCSAILGSELTPEKAKLIIDMGLPVYWFVDDDQAGHACMWGNWNKEEERFEGGGGIDLLYGHVAQFIVKWPEGKNDPDDLTAEEIEHMLETAEFYAKPVDNYRASKR